MTVDLYLSKDFYNLEPFSKSQWLIKWQVGKVSQKNLNISDHFVIYNLAKNGTRDCKTGIMMHEIDFGSIITLKALPFYFDILYIQGVINPFSCIFNQKLC